MADKLKRYLLFSGYRYDSVGGWGDFIDSFDSIEQARDHAKQRLHYYDWYEVVDIADGTKVDGEMYHEVKQWLLKSSPHRAI